MHWIRTNAYLWSIIQSEVCLAVKMHEISFTRYADGIYTIVCICVHIIYIYTIHIQAMINRHAKRSTVWSIQRTHALAHKHKQMHAHTCIHTHSLIETNAQRLRLGRRVSRGKQNNANDLKRKKTQPKKYVSNGFLMHLCFAHWLWCMVCMLNYCRQKSSNNYHSSQYHRNTKYTHTHTQMKSNKYWFKRILYKQIG